jgi:hypothetical protein
MTPDGRESSFGMTAWADGVGRRRGPTAAADDSLNQLGVRHLGCIISVKATSAGAPSTRLHATAALACLRICVMMPVCAKPRQVWLGLDLRSVVRIPQDGVAQHFGRGGAGPLEPNRAHLFRPFQSACCSAGLAPLRRVLPSLPAAVPSCILVSTVDTVEYSYLETPGLPWPLCSRATWVAAQVAHVSATDFPHDLADDELDELVTPKPSLRTRKGLPLLHGAHCCIALGCAGLSRRRVPLQEVPTT